jgi:hypothetical protein
VLTVASCLVPASVEQVSFQLPIGLQRYNLLDGSTDRAENNSKVERARLTPLVIGLILNDLYFVWGHARNGPKVLGIASNKRTLAQVGEDIVQAMFLSKVSDVAKHLILGQVGERVLDPVKG